MSKHIIYKIFNTVNGKCYIGQTRVGFEVRMCAHKCMLRRNKHSNTHLQNAWNKSGDEAFTFEVLESFQEDTEFDLNEREVYWIAKFDSTDRQFGYNLDGGGNVGKTVSAETKAKIRAAGKGRVPSTETRAKLSAANMGKKFALGNKAISKPVICTLTGKTYPSAKSAASALNMNHYTLTSWLSGRYPNKSSLQYITLEEAP